MEEIAERVFIMCEVIKFPVKKQLSNELEERFEKVSKDYVQLLNDAFDYLIDEDSTEEEMNKYMETILVTLIKDLTEAIDEMV